MPSKITKQTTVKPKKSMKPVKPTNASKRKSLTAKPRALAAKKPAKVNLWKRFSRSPGLVFALVFAVVGVGVISYSFAATTAEQKLPVISEIPTGRRLDVSSATSLKWALANALPGDQIMMADGVYKGNFVSNRNGAPTAKVLLMGSKNAVLDGGNKDKGTVLYLGRRNATFTTSYWQLQGFSVRNGARGIIFDNVQHSIINKVTVSNTGAEGIHLRTFSSDNTISSSIINGTGRTVQKYGEGIYVGTARSNWKEPSLEGKPDRSNRNKIINNTIRNTAAEAIDIKEGTHNGIIENNNFNGEGMCADRTQDCAFAQALIDMKGEGWKITGNTASNVHIVWMTGKAASAGFQNKAAGDSASEKSGKNNTFSKNIISNVGGYGFNMAVPSTLKCDNKVTKAGKGFSNQKCTK